MTGRMLLLLTAIFATASAAAPAAAHLDTNHARVAVVPSQAQPGTELQLIYTIDTTQPVRVVVQEHVDCEVTFPSGNTTAPCALDGSLVQVRLLEAGRQQFVFSYAAPDEVGNYTVRFSTNSTLTLLPANNDAQGTFQVLPAGNGTVDNETGSPAASGPGAKSPGPQMLPLLGLVAAVVWVVRRRL